MNKFLESILVDPVSKVTLQLDRTKAQFSENGEVQAGELVAANGSKFHIRNSIPRFVVADDEKQEQTEKSFGYKWSLTETYDSPNVVSESLKWFLPRYGFRSVEEMRERFSAGKVVLDAGCGAALSSSLWLGDRWAEKNNSQWVGADISEAIDVAQQRIGQIPNTHFVQADLLSLPFAPKTFDIIFSEGVLHHTPSTERAIKSLVPYLTDGGEFMFYVYRKKGPMREFADDLVRDAISDMSPQEAWEALRPLTKLGQALAELQTEVTVPEDVPFLGLKAGTYDVQRLLYWNFIKFFWNSEYSFEQNHHVNFDWYHPKYAHRQTEEDLRRWCAEVGLDIFHFDTHEAGYTVKAIRR